MKINQHFLIVLSFEVPPGKILDSTVDSMTGTPILMPLVSSIYPESPCGDELNIIIKL